MANRTVPQAYDCTPSSLMASNPCTNCLSETQMIAAIVGVIAVATGETAAQVLDESACFNCLSDKQMLQAILTKFGNELLGEEHTVPEVIDSMKCLLCAPQQQLKAALLLQLCKYITLTIKAQYTYTPET